jgi:alpha-ribazole phosphatase
LRIAQALQLQCRADDRLRELDFGDWDGRPYEEVWQQEQTAVMAFWQNPDASPPPGGETLAAFCARLQALENQLLTYPGLAQNPVHLLLLTHGGVIRGLLGRHLGLAVNKWSQLRIDTGSLSRLKIGYDREHRWCELSFMNWQPGLESLG